MRFWSEPLHERIRLQITPNKKSGLSEVRLWRKGELLDMQKIKNSKLNLVHF